MKPSLSAIRRWRATPDLLIFLAFLALTLVMTWPWVTHPRDAASDVGDPYLNSWILWWDYHQTFHEPLNLFHANIFYPYQYTLAFSEHNYGIAVLFFPLFALDFRPLTIHGLAAILGFAFCGYGAFRLARTLGGSNGVAWITGIAYAFVPYRFGQLPHLNYVFAGWIPILLEALILFVRQHTRRRAVWLGFVFFMNGLTCIHWFVLTLIPLGLSGIMLLIRYQKWREPALWRRGLIATGIATLALLPFLLPYSRAAQMYGFVRNAEETRLYSAELISWFVGDGRNKMWHRLNAAARSGEKELFPGLLPLLFGAAAVFLVKPLRRNDETKFNRWPALQKIVVGLDAALVIFSILLVTISGYGFFKLRVFGFYLLEIYSTGPVLIALLIALAVRFSICYPEIFTRERENTLISSFRSRRRDDGFWLAVVWIALGFFGSLGMNFPFHRFLFEYVPMFRAIRVPARWAMICYLGLALLAGLGAKQLIELSARHWPQLRAAPLYVVLAIAFMVEQRAAPLKLIHGAVDPDALTIWFKQTPMTGGIVELPTTDGGEPNYFYILRAADHGRPLVTAVSGFNPPLNRQITELTSGDNIPDTFIDLLEQIPCSYLVLNKQYVHPEKLPRFEAFLAGATASGRLRFIRSYGNRDLYAVTKIEPGAMSDLR